MMPKRPALEHAGEVQAARTGRRRAADGQVLVIFALSIFVFMGICAVVIDVSWYWANTLRVQRAADAAALAGVVDLPGNLSGAIAFADTAATQNGYTGGGGVTVSANQDSLLTTGGNPNQMDVTVSAPVNTFFMRLIGINSITASRTAHAQYATLVPMGSPLNYYGDFGVINPASGSSTPVKGPGGQTLNAQGFWAEMLSAGAETISGDAFLPHWDTASSSTVSTMPQNTQSYYNYAVQMPAGSSSGQVWIFDPGFCETDGTSGTGDAWYTSTHNPVSAFYTLTNTNNEPWNPADWTNNVATSGTTFMDESGSDTAMGGGGGASCDTYHNKWYELASGLSADATLGSLYLLHTTTTYPYATGSDPKNQQNTNARNGFAIFVTATGGTPQVYGDGAMEMFTPLPGGQTSTFYLAQVDAKYAGKTMQILLWDPGDTNQTAYMQILQPTTTGYSTIAFNYTAKQGTTNSNASNCNSNSGTGVTQLYTYQSGASKFNGCWVTINIVIPSTYTAPTPPGEPGAGWWKITYTMQGSSGTTSTDITTWKVNIIGNPVHLVLPTAP